MDMKSAQQAAFDKMMTHLRTQGRKAADACGRCLYWDCDTNRKCAIGVLMIMDNYDGSVEDTDVQTLMGYDPPVFPDDIIDAGVSFLEDAQCLLHDACFDYLRDLEENAEMLAKSYDLTYSPPA